jgi:mevalonate kinase
MASANGKLILFGEHAVVHGQPAIAVPLQAVSVAIEATPAQKRHGITVHLERTGATVHLPIPLDITGPNIPSHTDLALIRPIELALHHLQHPTVPDLELHIQSNIPIASGFGSGAALSKALMTTIFDYLGHTPSMKELNDLVYEAEKLHHGTPSGIDNTVIVYEKPVYFVRGEPIQTFAIPQPFELIVAHVGHATATHITVGAVGDLYAAEPQRIGAVFEAIGDIVNAAQDAIQNGDVLKLGPLMTQNHDLLRTLTVSDDTLDDFCHVANVNGALGAKLSGGGRGGNMIALVTADTREQVATALRQNGAQHIIHTTVQ